MHSPISSCCVGCCAALAARLMRDELAARVGTEMDAYTQVCASSAAVLFARVTGLLSLSMHGWLRLSYPLRFS